MWLILLLALIDTSYSTDSICPDASNSGGTTHFPHPTNCAKFVVCNWGQPMEHDCPAGTLWNDLVKTCDHARNVQCGRGLVQSTFVAGNHPRNHHNPNCPRVTATHRPIYAPHQDCTKYYLCTAAGAQEMACSPGSNWNINTNRCERSDSMGSHVHTPPPPAPPTTASPPTTTPEPPLSGCPKTIEPNKPVYLPHSDCSMFYMCTSKGPKELHCISGYHWSVSSNSCEFPWDAGCIDINGSPSPITTTTTTTTTTTSTPAPTQASNGPCPGQVDPNNLVFLLHPDRTKIYICVAGMVRMEFSCPQGLWWSENNVCIPMENTRTNRPPLNTTPVVGVQRRTTTASSTTNVTEESTEPDEAFGTDGPIFG